MGKIGIKQIKMAENLIKIATPKDVYKFSLGAYTFHKASEFLEDDGFDGEGINHYLLHWSDPLRLGYKGFFTFIIKKKGAPSGCGEGKRGKKALEELKESVAEYTSPHFTPPYFALTAPKNYQKVAGVFQDLGWQVERLLAKK